MRKIRNFFRWGPRAADIWNVLQWLFPPLGAIVTGLQASLEGAAWHLIFFYSAIVFCLILVAIAAGHYVARHRAVFERLRYVRTEPIIVEPRLTQNTIGIIFKCTLMNMSQTRSIYIALRRGDARLQGRTNPDPVLKDEVVIVPPFSDFAINIAAVPNVDVSQEIKGKLEVEVAYGPTPDDLRFVLAYECEPRLEIKNLTDKDAQLVFTGPLRKYQHKRN